MPAFPSRYEFKWAGCSLIIPQILGILVGIAYAIYDPEDYNASIYEARTEEEVIKLHDVLSSEKIKGMVEINAAWYWLSFPFYLIAIYGIRKFYVSMFAGSKAEMWIYVMEKSYLFSLLMTNIVGPAISLVIVSFEWEIHEYTSADDFVPTAYYIQLFALVLVEELYDAVCIADGLFLTLVCLIPNFRYFTSDPKYNVLKSQRIRCRVCRHTMMLIFAASIAITYLISLFRFADSGFFSLNGGASWVPIYGYFLKFGIGGRFYFIGRSKSARYDELKEAFGDKADSTMLGNEAGNDADEYKMETIDIKDVADDNL